MGRFELLRTTRPRKDLEIRPLLSKIVLQFESLFAIKPASLEIPTGFIIKPALVYLLSTRRENSIQVLSDLLHEKTIVDSIDSHLVNCSTEL